MASKVFSERITVNCTPEQKAAFKAARAKAADGLSNNQFLHTLLADYCASHDEAWPEVETQTRGKGRAPWKIGEGGKFVKP